MVIRMLVYKGALRRRRTSFSGRGEIQGNRRGEGVRHMGAASRPVQTA